MPETMNGVLTLHWSDERMKGFLGCNRPAQRTASETVRDTIARCLAMSNPPEKFLLKLVSAADVDDLLRMVEGLAEYVNEPDAVHVSRETYLRDGFSDETPLFYSLLLEYSDSETKQPHICGMAFCYLGCSLRDGHFLYLEDLFLEEAYRGKGVGTYTLRTLAAIALSLGCSRLVWQALDWNKPALAFYDKIGADTQQGLLTSRFTGKQLSALSEARVPP
jgi:GNAT superfamily N-acetyltransferase